MRVLLIVTARELDIIPAYEHWNVYEVGQEDCKKMRVRSPVWYINPTDTRRSGQAFQIDRAGASLLVGILLRESGHQS